MFPTSFIRFNPFAESSHSVPTIRETMQSFAAIRSSPRLLPSSRTCLLPFARASTTPFKAADPAVHSEPPQGEDADEAVKSAAAEQEHGNRSNQQKSTTEPIKKTPFASSPKLESTGVGQAVDPTFQQKRRLSSATAAWLDDVACVGVDGSPLNGKDSQWSYREEEEDDDDDREYYKDHKASPLSEIEIADTRLPISRATDGEKDDRWGGEGRGYLIEDTVDDALQRAEAMFNAARERGDPSWPHSRALMRKLAELYQSQGSEFRSGGSS